MKDDQHLIDLFDEKLKIRDIQIAANQQLTDQKFVSQNEALVLARGELKDRLHDLNDVRLRFMPRNEYDAKHEALVTRIEAIERFQTTEVGQHQGMNMIWVWFLGGLTVLSGLIALVLNSIRLFGEGK